MNVGLDVEKGMSNGAVPKVMLMRTLSLFPRKSVA